LNQNNNETSVLSEAVALIESDKLTKAIDDVQQHLYGNKTTEDSWVGNDLLKAIQEVNTSGIKGKSNPNFTLNPS
jgi:hypothetical protein